MVIPNHKRASIIKNFVTVSRFEPRPETAAPAEDHYKISFSTAREFMTVVEQVDGKTLETVFRTKNFLLKMLIRKAALELRSPKR